MDLGGLAQIVTHKKFELFAPHAALCVDVFDSSYNAHYADLPGFS